MSHRPLIAAAVASLFIASGAAAFAATQEYDITVPITVNGLSAGAPGLRRGINVYCAVGGQSLAYSTATGDATGAAGKGSTERVALTGPDGKPLSMPINVKVVVTDAQTAGNNVGAGPSGGVSSQYLCWGKLTSSGGDTLPTPLNFVSGPLRPL